MSNGVIQYSMLPPFPALIQYPWPAAESGTR